MLKAQIVVVWSDEKQSARPFTGVVHFVMGTHFSAESTKPESAPDTQSSAGTYKAPYKFLSHVQNNHSRTIIDDMTNMEYINRCNEILKKLPNRTFIRSFVCSDDSSLRGAFPNDLVEMIGSYIGVHFKFPPIEILRFSASGKLSTWCFKHWWTYSFCIR